MTEANLGRMRTMSEAWDREAEICGRRGAA